MAHKVHIGQQFDDFFGFESFIEDYLYNECVQFFRRDSRTVEKAVGRLPNRTLNAAIKYYEAKYNCIRVHCLHMRLCQDGQLH